MALIQEAGVGDLNTIRQIAYSTWPVAYGQILSTAQLNYMLETLFCDEKLLKDMSEGGQKFIILKDGQLALGFAAYGPHLKEKDAIKLHKIYMLPGSQGLGLGKVLLEAVIQDAAKSGFERLVLNVNRHNKAKLFYEKMGFRVLREEDIPIGPYWMNDYVMTLSLSLLPRKDLNR